MKPNDAPNIMNPLGGIQAIRTRNHNHWRQTFSRSHSLPHNDYLVLIPAYNEKTTIREVALRALRFVERVIIIDDGSIDHTAEMVEDLPVNLVRNTQNMGKGASLWQGFQRAMEFDISGVITLDGDGQHSPEDIPRLLAQAKNMPQALIIGARTGTWDWNSWHRRLANKIADFWISWAAGYAIADSQSGFRVYPTSLIRQIAIRHDKQRSFVFESEILIEGAKLGFVSFPVHIKSKHRKTSRVSHFRPIGDILEITKMVAWKLLSRGMFMTGLYQSLRSRIQVRRETTTRHVSPS